MSSDYIVGKNKFTLKRNGVTNIVTAEDIIDQVIFINPKLPKLFEFTTNSLRPKSHQIFWNLPFIRKRIECDYFDVYCLDGGAHDRPTFRGQFETLDGAITCALELFDEYFNSQFN